MDWCLANKVEISQLFSEFAIRSALFASVNEYSLYAALMLSIITSESIMNSELHTESCSFYSLIRSELVARVNPATVFLDDFLKNLYKHCRKNPYRLKKFCTFFSTWYQIKGFCKYYWNKAYISQSDYTELFYKH